MGNHEYMFLEFLALKDNNIQSIEWLSSDRDFSTINIFITEDTKNKIERLRNGKSQSSLITKLVSLIRFDIIKNNSELIKWLKDL